VENKGRRRGEWRGRGGDDQPVGRTMVTGSAGRQWRPGTNATGRWHERGGNPSFSRVHALCSRALARACALAPAEPGSPDAPIFHAWREPGSEPPFASGGTGRESEQPTKRSGVASGGPGCPRCTQPIRPLIAPLDWRDECTFHGLQRLLDPALTPLVAHPNQQSHILKMAADDNIRKFSRLVTEAGTC
jgi:hypothetical protein